MISPGLGWIAPCISCPCIKRPWSRGLNARVDARNGDMNGPAAQHGHGERTLIQERSLCARRSHSKVAWLISLHDTSYTSSRKTSRHALEKWKMKKQRYIICLLVLTSLSNFLCFLMMISKDWKPNEIWRCLSTVWLKAEAGVGLRLFFEWAWSVGVGWIDSSVLQFLFLNLSFSLSYAQIRDLCRGKIKFTYKSITMTPRGRHTTLYCN